MKPLIGSVKWLIKKHFPSVVYLYYLWQRGFRRKNAHELWSDLLSELNAKIPDVFFLQVGAMDGVSFDPLYNHVISYNWQGLLVEPLPDVFELLKKTYHGKTGLILENVAIANVSGVRAIYRVPLEAVEKKLVPKWVKGSSSFFPDKTQLGGVGISKQVFEQIRPHIVVEEVECVTLNFLLTKHNVSKIDIFQIDVEGYDYQVLKELDFNKFRPSVIRMEWHNLVNSEKKLSLRLLKQYGYRTKLFDGDLLAWHKLPIRSAFYRTKEALG